MVLIAGSDGLIGAALKESIISQGISCWATSRRSGSKVPRLDLVDDPNSWQLPGKVDTAFLCMAQCSLKACEEAPVQTAFINVERTVELARRLLARDAFVVFLSTNLVFDGSRPFFTPDDPPNPTTEYGRQKLSAENALQSLYSNVAIVRLTKVVHPNMALIQAWRETLQRGEIIQPFCDFLFSPIQLSFVVDALEKIAARKLVGITHLSGDCDVSYEELARMLAKSLSVDEALVRSTSAPPEKRGFSTLNMDRAVRELGIQVPSVLQSLEFLFNKNVN
jgi:dTDP-4-dehydrorhamnose reductase